MTDSWGVQSDLSRRRGAARLLLGENCALGFGAQFRRLHSKRICQFEYRGDGGLVLPGLDLGNEVALYAGLQPQLLLTQPCGQPKPAQCASQGGVVCERIVFQHMVKLSDFQ